MDLTLQGSGVQQFIASGEKTQGGGWWRCWIQEAERPSLELGSGQGAKKSPRAPLTASQQLMCPEAADSALPPLPHASPAADKSIWGKPCSVWGWLQGSTRVPLLADEQAGSRTAEGGHAVGLSPGAAGPKYTLAAKDWPHRHAIHPLHGSLSSGKTPTPYSHWISKT